jgi:hypothetical protein
MTGRVPKKFKNNYVGTDANVMIGISIQLTTMLRDVVICQT